MAFDTTRLSARITIKGSLPDGRFEDQELLDFAYDSLLSEMVPAIIAVREDYYVTYQDLAITADQAAYAIPSRALNGVVREVRVVRTDNSIVDLDRCELEDVTTAVAGTPCAFYTSGNSLVLYPTPSTTENTLRVWYFARPSRLVPVAECAVITAIDTAAKTVTATPPSGWTTADTFDLVRGRAHFDMLGVDLVATSVTGSSIVFSATLPTTLAVGDYVALAEETCFPSLPPEGHVALVQSAVTSALESLGDPAATTSAAKTQSLLASFKAVLSTRVQGEPKHLGRRVL